MLLIPIPISGLFATDLRIRLFMAPKRSLGLKQFVSFTELRSAKFLMVGASQLHTTALSMMVRGELAKGQRPFASCTRSSEKLHKPHVTACTALHAAAQHATHGACRL